MGKLIKTSRTKKKQEVGKALRAPPKTKEFGGKNYDRWTGISTKSRADQIAKDCRKDGMKVRVHPKKTKSGKDVFWLYYRDK